MGKFDGADVGARVEFVDNVDSIEVSITLPDSDDSLVNLRSMDW